MYRKYIVFLIIVLSISCIADVEVSIKAKISGKLYEKKVPSDINEFSLIAIHAGFEEINGLVNLKNLRTLKLYPGVKNYSFLKELPNIEKLILDGCSIDSFEFLKFLPNIKVLYINGARLDDDKCKIDLQWNPDLYYIAIHNLHNKNKDLYFNFEIRNIPKSLEFINFSRNYYVIITDDLIHQLSQISNIILNEKYYLENIDLYKDFNIILEDGDERFPSEYHPNILSKKSEYYISPWE